MAKFTPTRRGNPCVICENSTGKCREHSEGEVYLCMSFADSRLGEIQNGHKCIKPDSGKGWSTWKIDNSQEWTEQQRQEWQQRNQQRRQLQAKENSERRQQSLSAVERDKQYREILAQLTLHADDRADLVRRGFTNEQIELCGFKSVERYQKLQSQFNELLPGVTGNGKRLIVSSAGYLCPVRNADGLIVACQVRLRTLPTSESNRYRWLSGNGQTLHLYPDGSKSDGELPLAVFRPQGKPTGISLAEGTGAKPFLVSQRFNQIVIGAAGGQWASSEAIFRATLEQTLLELEGTKQLTIYPDAGDILNPSVMKRWQAVVDLLQQWNWSIKFAWWGQADKTHPDIDELENFSSITYISPDEFWAIGKGHPVEQKGFDPEPQWKVKARDAWRKNRQFSADVKEEERWCNFARPGANTMAFLKAGLGRGKTTVVRGWVKEWKATDDVGFYLFGYRNTLLLQLCGSEKGLGFHHLHEHSGMAMKSAPSEGIALCVDSLWRFSPEDFDDKIIILDEVKSVIKHLLHSPTIKGRDKIISLFAEAIKRARQVICLDGLMTDWVVDYLSSLAPEKQIIKAENTYVGEKPRVNFLLGTLRDDDTIRVNDRSPWLQYLLEESELPAVCSDSQVMLEALDELLTAKGLKVLRIDSKTVPEPHIKECLLNCDKYIEANRPDVLLYSPAAESGVDVSITNHFTHHFCFFFGVLDIDGISQMMGRLRANIIKFVWCKSFVVDDERQDSGSPFTNQIAKSINQTLADDISTSLDKDDWLERVTNHLKEVIANSLNQDLRTSCIIKATQNYEKSNLRECLREVLVESGYKVVNCTLENDEHAKKKVSKATEAVKQQNCSNIFNAEKIAPELVDELKFDSTWEERCKVIQAKLRERLPGIEDSSVWNEDFIYLIRYHDRNFISNIENYWLFNHPDIAKRQSQDNLHWMARRLHTFIGNVKSRWARIHALLEMKFEQFLDPDKEWSNESPELITLVELGKKYSNALGKHPGKSTPVQFLGNLLVLFGLKLKSRKDSESKRWYRLNEEVINDPIRQQVLTCVEAKLTQPKEKIDWESAINEAHGTQTEKTLEMQTEQGLEGAAPSPNFLYTNYIEGAVNNSTSESHELNQILRGVSEVVEPMTAAEVVEPNEVVEGASLVGLLAIVATYEAFTQAIRGASSEAVEDAIASQDTQPARLQLAQWHAAAAEAVEPVVAPALELEPVVGSRVRVSSRVAGFRAWEAGMTGLVKVVEPIRNTYTIECQDGKTRYYPSELLETLELQPEVAAAETVEAIKTIEVIPFIPELVAGAEVRVTLRNVKDEKAKAVRASHEGFIGVIELAQPEQDYYTVKISDGKIRHYSSEWLELVEDAIASPLSTDDSWIVPFLKDVAQNDKFEDLKELAQESEFPLDKLRKLSPKIVEKDESVEPYKRLRLMFDALAGVFDGWVTNPYLQMV